ncbi:alanine racemase [Novosphingobium sp. CF614]|uniref:alanine racemase n=1 Tax=Novosphingobium sp. CF614 TaxID=1884364 RepID=UPI0008EE1D28|nr:alanine racemase [Novosphingobium sp. CF614]SFG51746.1 alanine racemase [Novosphingobium sp. CF614]
MKRRSFLAAGTGLAFAAASRAMAAPILSADNFGLTLAQARRRNGWIEIDTKAFETNIDTIRALIGPVHLCAVMKADAYGNGIALLMPSILKKRIGDVAITSNDEARVARQLGYRGRLIRIRTATPEEMEDGIPLAIEELIGNPEAAARLQQLARDKGRRGRLPVHLALNSGGMSRNGIELSTDYGKADARALLAFDRLVIAGVMTHYPSEEEPDILGQLQHYREDLTWLQSQGLKTSAMALHTANSFATLKHRETWLDMVRVGGLLYGDPGSVKTDAYRPTMAIKSRVAAINHYPAGQTVNYDRTFQLERESWLANIPLGYSDGYRRGFSHANLPKFPSETRNRTEVLIRGRRFPVVGRVTMNTMMVDVTEGRDLVRLDDEVVLFGAQGGQHITQAEFETNSSAYGPEMLAVLGATLPRVLMPGGANGDDSRSPA